MPCYDERCEMQEREENQRARRNEAVLCGILSAMEAAAEFEQDREPVYRVEDLFDRIDWTAVGISRKNFIKWWEDHKSKDTARKAQEEKSAEEQKARRAALAKLTPKERALLGVR